MQFSHLYSSALDRELGTDDSTRLFTTARRKAAINEACLQFADLTECLPKTIDITCSNGISEYNLLSTAHAGSTLADFVRLHGTQPEYRLASSGSSASTVSQAGNNFRLRSINWLNAQEPGWRESTGGTPTAFYLRQAGLVGNIRVGLVPPPEIGSSETGTLNLTYISKPLEMVSDTELPFFTGTVHANGHLEPYHQGLVHYAASQLEKLRKDWPAVQVQHQLFLGFVQRFKGADDGHAPRQVRTARNYFAEARQRRGWRPDPWWIGR